VTGDRVVADDQVAVRSRSGGDLGARRVDEFIAAARDESARRGV
jgi:threonyl-tRNA synthetase